MKKENSMKVGRVEPVKSIRRENRTKEPEQKNQNDDKQENESFQNKMEQKSQEKEKKPNSLIWDIYQMSICGTQEKQNELIEKGSYVRKRTPSQNSLSAYRKE